MKELKKHASLSEQVALLDNRGLLIDDKKAVEAVLANVNYYRLSGYLHDFKAQDKNRYIEGLTWTRLKRIYDFDRKFTRILMYALEDIEETFKTRLSYCLTSAFPDDPLIYLDSSIYRDIDQFNKFEKLFNREKKKNSNLPFVKHHYNEYEGKLPMWVAVELFTMGNLQAVYNNLISRFQKALAKSYNTGPNQLSSWLENLTYVRNHLAHYMRIYNFNFGRTPANCDKHPRNFTPSHMIFDQIFVMACMYSDPDEWNSYVLPEIKNLLDEYSADIVLSDIGFPENWEAILERKILCFANA